LNKGRDLAKKNFKKLEQIAKALLSQEIITHEELMAIVSPTNTKGGGSEKTSKSAKSNGELNPALT
jgi:cell division protease FtsH